MGSAGFGTLQEKGAYWVRNTMRLSTLDFLHTQTFGLWRAGNMSPPS